jgi:GntR family transcriptional regulator/MocR family aminotransferase
MLPYKTLIQLNRNSEISLYLQVCNSFISLITKGTLKPSDSLPSTRVLADLIGINRNTIKLAYEELINQGWAESAERKGVFVQSKLPTLSKASSLNATVIDSYQHAFHWADSFKNAVASKDLQKASLAIDDGFPDVRLAPIDQLMREYRSISRKFYGKNFLRYGSSMGSERLRISVSNYLSHTRGVSVTPEQILITKGSQMAIYLASQLLLEPNTSIAVGLSNYLLADDCFRHAGGSVIRIPVDSSGMDINYLEKVLETQKIRAVYVIPHHHLPTTVTLSSDRRLMLLSLAKKHRFAIIEDDYDFDFHYENKPFLPLASIDHSQNVIYIGSISKTFAPALRIGFMIGPADFITAAASLRQLIDRQGDTLMEEAFSVMFENGEMERHFRKSQKTYKARRDHFCGVLQKEFKEHITFSVPEGGLGVWANFVDDVDLHEVSRLAGKKGLYIDNGDFYKNEAFSTNAMRLGFASLNEAETDKALQILSEVLQTRS